MFKPIDATYSYNTPVGLAMNVKDNKSNDSNSKKYAKTIIKELRENSDFKLLEDSSSKLGGLSAYKIYFVLGDKKYLIIYALTPEKIFEITLVANTENFENHLEIVRQMVASFQFL